MSTGLECDFIEYEPGKWYYILQNGSCPRDAWDWREYATAYGPFGSEDAALGHLSRNHANPGGFSSTNYSPKNHAVLEQDEVFQKLLKGTKARGR